jgi:hypothetical protein
MAEGKALDIIGWRVAQLFFQIDTTGFVLVPLECGKCATSGFLMAYEATPVTIGNCGGYQQVQPIGNKE